MKFIYKSKRPKLVSIILAEGDVLELTHAKAINRAQRHRDFEEVQTVAKPKKASKATSKNLTI